MGGEKICRSLSRTFQWGSPPRGRGKGGRIHQGRRRAGITPAWAGKRPGGTSHPSVSRDHPRVGGEKLWLHSSMRERRGSPPRGRGKVAAGGPFFCCFRITPAWAGKSPTTPSPASSTEDHPRVGGEKSLVLVMMCSSFGSPPRGRGKDGGEVGVVAGQGITPAWAGKSAAGV